jgi:subtilisin-like proprotein convertase family protein
MTVAACISLTVATVVPSAVAGARPSAPDPVKAATLEPGRVLARVAVRGAGDRDAARQLGVVVEEYGPFTVVSATAETIERVRRLRPSLDLQLLDTQIHAGGFQFEPSREDPARAFLSAGGYTLSPNPTGDYFLVQFVAPARDNWIAAVENAGGQVLQYVPSHAFIVKATPTAIERIEQLPAVRWAGPLHPAYKLNPDLMWAIGGGAKTASGARTTAGWGSTGVAAYDVAIFRDASLDAAAADVAREGGRVVKRIPLTNNFFNVLRVELAPDRVRAIARLRDVITIDPYIEPQAEDERAAHIIAGNYTNTTTIAGPGYNPLTQFGVDGAGVTVAVVDDGVGIPGVGGFYITSSNTTNGPLRGASTGADGHGHLNATIISGDAPFATLDPTGHNYGLGVAPKSHVVNIPLLRPGYSGSEADTCNDTVTTNGPNGAPGYVSNNSWGSGTNGNSYDSFAAQYDGFVRDASAAGTIDPLVVVFSAGNSGASGLTRPKMAKNVIAVAASENRRTELANPTRHDNIDDIADFSSRGPAADGRIKPEITAPGSGVSGGRSGSDSLFGNIDANHRWSEGTSHAAPQVAGAVALFVQWWRSTHAGANPSPALVKAALVNGAVEMAGALATAPIPNGNEGWGRINLKNVLNTGTATEYVNESVPLTATGAFYTMTGTIQDPTKPVRVSLAWLDPPGLGNPALVNNLDLEVTVGGVTYKGNVFAGGGSVSGGNFNTVDNLENVFLPAGFPAGTPFSIKVTAAAINGDGILGNGDTTDQHFALVATNVVATPAAVLAGGGATITAESCAPGNGVADPGETVTVDFTLSNIGTAATSNLVATLQATGGVTSPSAAQNYGALASGGGSAARSFTFTATGTCGGLVTASLQLQDGATNLGTADFTFRLGALGAPVSASYSSNGVNVPIPASGTSGDMVDQIIAVADTGVVQSVKARVRLNHTYDGDITITLVAPNGTAVPLASRRGSSGANFGSGATDCSGTFTVFDDAAATAISAGTAPFAGAFRPDGSLAALAGSPSEGNWTLKINDGASGDSGTLFCWQLEITRAQYECCGGAIPSGLDTIGLFDPATGSYFLRNSNSSGGADVVFSFGPGGAMPITGDWNGDGTDTAGVYIPGTGAFFLRNTNTPGPADIIFTFGGGGALVPLVGDWNNDGTDTIGLYDPATGAFFLRNANSSGGADLLFTFGAGGGYQPIVGEWNNDGTDTVGLYDPASGAFFLKNANSSGGADAVFTFGAGGAFRAITGDWNADGTETVGIYDPATGAFFLTNTNASGPAAIVFTFGAGGAGFVPLSGDWNG